MARPRHSLTEMAQRAPTKVRLLVLDTLRAASYDYAMAGAMLGVSGRQLRVICQRFGVTDEVVRLRQRAGYDRRGRPRKEVPSRVVLQRVLATADGCVSEAARALGVSIPTFKAWLAAA